MYGNYEYSYFQNMNEVLDVSKNFKGRPLGILIDENTTYSKNYGDNEFSYFYQLIYNNININIFKVTLEKPRSQIINGGHFPLYFYLELNENKEVNIVVNIRLNANDDFELEEDIEIYGYLISEDDINRIINDNYFNLKEGYFSNAFNIGFIQIVSELKVYKCILIEIKKKGIQK